MRACPYLEVVIRLYCTCDKREGRGGTSPGGGPCGASPHHCSDQDGRAFRGKKEQLEVVVFGAPLP